MRGGAGDGDGRDCIFTVNLPFKFKYVTNIILSPLKTLKTTIRNVGISIQRLEVPPGHVIKQLRNLSAVFL